MAATSVQLEDTEQGPRAEPRAGNVKLAVGSHVRLQIMSDRTMWGASPIPNDETTDSLHAGAVGAPATFESSVRKRSEEMLTPAQYEGAIHDYHRSPPHPLKRRNGDSPVSYSDLQP